MSIHSLDLAIESTCHVLLPPDASACKAVHHLVVPDRMQNGPARLLVDHGILAPPPARARSRVPSY